MLRHTQHVMDATACTDAAYDLRVGRRRLRTGPSSPNLRLPITAFAYGSMSTAACMPRVCDGHNEHDGSTTNFTVLLI